MHLSRRTIRSCLLVLCMTLLITRVAGDHLHLCFDGSEPPVSLHAVDMPDHHGEEEFEHDDKDIGLPEMTFAKVMSFLPDFALVAAVVIGLVELVTRQHIRPEFLIRDLEHSSLHFLRPPLRGPPELLRN
jgi:hypothetical protein